MARPAGLPHLPAQPSAPVDPPFPGEGDTESCSHFVLCAARALDPSLGPKTRGLGVVPSEASSLCGPEG